MSAIYLHTVDISKVTPYMPLFHTYVKSWQRYCDTFIISKKSAYILSIIQNDSYIFSQINHSESITSFNHSFKSMILIIQKSIISLSNQSMKIDHLKSIFDTLSLMDNESIHVSILTFKWHQLMMFVSTDIGYLWLRFNYMLRISVPSVVAKILTSLHLNLGGTVAIWTVFRERLFRETV